MATARLEPSGAVMALDLHDIFFSTTDRKGVIELANAVFVRLSGYEFEELSGEPHNIIRHPAMPGGAFHLVWEALGAGEPAVAYVHNLDRSGARYTVLSTLLPVGDVLLSVRVPPCCPDRLAIADHLYGRARQVEDQARAGGAGRAAAAERGAAQLVTDLEAADIPSFAAYCQDLLPAEVAARTRRGAALPRREGAEGAPADLLRAARAVHDQTGDLVSALDELADLAKSLVATAREVTPAMDRLVTASASAQSLCEPRREAEPALADIAGSMAARAATGRAVAEELGDTLDRAAARARSLRFRIAMARLHTIMVAHFAAELVDGAAAPRAGEAITLLSLALREGMDAASAELDATRTDFGGISDQVGVATRAVSGFQRQRRKWLAELPESPDDELARAAADVRQEDGAPGLLDRLGELAARGANLYVPLDTDAIGAELDRIEAAGQRVG